MENVLNWNNKNKLTVEFLFRSRHYVVNIVHIVYVIFLKYIPFIYGTHKSSWPRMTPHHLTMLTSTMYIPELIPIVYLRSSYWIRLYFGVYNVDISWIKYHSFHTFHSFIIHEILPELLKNITNLLSRSRCRFKLLLPKSVKFCQRVFNFSLIGQILSNLVTLNWTLSRAYPLKIS